MSASVAVAPMGWLVVLGLASVVSFGASSPRITDVAIGTRPEEDSHVLHRTDRIEAGTFSILGCDASYEDLPPYRSGQDPAIKLVWTFTPPGGVEREIHGANYWRSGAGTVMGAWGDQERGSPPGRYTCTWSYGSSRVAASIEVR